jgi:hypothetical protein
MSSLKLAPVRRDKTTESDTMKRYALVLAGMILCSASAFAQEPQQIDPRLAGPAMNALRAQMALLDAALKAANEDAQKREADLAGWFKGWFGEKPAESAK